MCIRDSLSGEIVIGAGLTMSVGTGATTGQGSIKSLKVSNTFTPPIGGTNDRPSAPKPGALFYNKDFRTIEYWDGNFWRQVDNTTRSGRVSLTGGHTGSYQTHCKDIDSFLIPTLGSAIDWGELANSSAEQAGCCDGTRGVVAGGYVHPGTTVNIMEYITIPSASKSIDFGDLTTAANIGERGANSSTRGMFGNVGPTRQVDYVEIQTLGNAIDFGDLVTTNHKGPGVCSPIRCIWGPDNSNPKIEGCITASKGSKFYFGNAMTRRVYAGCSNSIRGLFSGGYVGPAAVMHKEIQSVDLTSEGNAVDFGNLSVDHGSYMTSSSNQTRAVFQGGYISSGVTGNVIEYISFTSGGTVADFGDLTRPKSSQGTCSDSNGGLGGF